MQDSLPTALAVPLDENSIEARWPVLDLVCLSRQRYEQLVALEEALQGQDKKIRETMLLNLNQTSGLGLQMN